MHRDKQFAGEGISLRALAKIFVALALMGLQGCGQFDRWARQSLNTAGAEKLAAAAPAIRQNSSASRRQQMADQDFVSRCHGSGVIRCIGFDSNADITGHLLPAWDERFRAEVDSSVAASGEGSLRFEIPSNSPANTSGSFWVNFSDDLSVQFGQGEEFYIQWRQRFSSEFLKTNFAPGEGWKQIIVGEGDRPGFRANSCTQLELVVQNEYLRRLPQMYHSCGGKDGRYESLQYFDDRLGNVVVQNAVGCLYPDFRKPPCVTYRADQWMTFQLHVRIGTWYKNDGGYHRDSTVQLWVAEEGKPSKLVIDFGPRSGHGYDLANERLAAKYGKIWLLPYQTNKDTSQSHPTAYTWYDELIISRSRIPDPQ